MPPQRAKVEPSPARKSGDKLTPKERGCFQCSRRRIICDKAEPSCGKCIKKGIECSGVNRIRFTEGVARRGRFKDCKIPNDTIDGLNRLPATTAFAGVQWPEERKTKTKAKRSGQIKANLDASLCSEVSWDFDAQTPSPLPGNEDQLDICLSDFGSSPQPSTVPEELDEDVEEIVRTDNAILQRRSTYSTVQPWVAPLSAEARMLFSYFSEAVAPVMVILDTKANGYRELVLPMAFEDEVLRRAVGVVAAQHLSRERPEMQEAAEAGRAAIISRLRKDSLSATADQVFNKFTWATLIVLLVGETVTGSADYGFLVHMLLCLSANSRADGENFSALRFLQTQTTMFELLALPLLGEQNGLLAMQRCFKQWQNWLIYEEFPPGSENHRLIEQIRFCFAAACDIYVRRATSEDAASGTHSSPQFEALQTANIQSMIDRLSRIPPQSPGAHALVWPCFVAGAETTDPDQRAFFVDYMNSIYARTKFRNIPAAVDSLEKLWANRRGQRWTQYLHEFSNVLVM